MLRLCTGRRLVQGIGRSAAGLGERGRSVSSLADKHKDFLDLVKSHGEGSVRFHLSDNVEGLGYIYLDNPKTKNALTGRMMSEFVTAIQEASNAVAGTPKLRCLVLQGKNDAFCAGADFTLAREVLTTPELGLAMCKFMTDVTSHLLALPVISVAVVTGPAMGGGAELTTACDFRLMTPNSFVQFVQAKMGVSPGWGGAGRLVRMVGRRKTLQLLGGSLKMDAQLAQQLEYADGVVTADGLEEQLKTFFELYLSQKHPGALHAIKRAIHTADTSSPEQARDAEMAAFASRWGGEDNKQALKKR